MDIRFTPHNMHLTDKELFRQHDPHLQALAEQKYIYHAPLIDEIPRDIPGIYTVCGGRQIGKSTLLKLIMRMLSPYNGEILYDDTELRDVGDDDIYKAFAYIQQETVIFDTSILNNITMYQNFSKDEIDMVIKQSGLTHLVKQRGIDYECGE